MVVPARNASGDWMMWRVGRRRLAWRPRYIGWHPSEGYEFEFLFAILLVVNIVPVLAWLLNWLMCLLVSVVVWPWRAMTGRWPVVAYSVDNGGPGDGFQREYVQGRAAANALVRQWTEKIKKTGHPRREPVPEGIESDQLGLRPR